MLNLLIVRFLSVSISVKDVGARRIRRSELYHRRMKKHKQGSFVPKTVIGWRNKHKRSGFVLKSVMSVRNKHKWVSFVPEIGWVLN